MTHSAFDAFTRRTAAGISRRRSLMTLAGVGLAAAAAKPSIADAKKNSAKKAKKKAKQKCKKQVGQCRTFVTQVLCANRMNPAGCEFQSLGCCDAFSTCNASGALNCFASAGMA